MTYASLATAVRYSAARPAQFKQVSCDFFRRVASARAAHGMWYSRRRTAAVSTSVLSAAPQATGTEPVAVTQTSLHLAIKKTQLARYARASKNLTCCDVISTRGTWFAGATRVSAHSKRTDSKAAPQWRQISPQNQCVDKHAPTSYL